MHAALGHVPDQPGVDGAEQQIAVFGGCAIFAECAFPKADVALYCQCEILAPNLFAVLGRNRGNRIVKVAEHGVHNHIAVCAGSIQETIVSNINFMVNPCNITIAFHQSEELNCAVQASLTLEVVAL